MRGARSWPLRGARSWSLRGARSGRELLALAFACALAACAGPHYLSEPSAPDWRGQPLSWEKLAAIESWLADADAQTDPGDRLEAVLELAEGRLAFAAEDRGRDPSAPVSARLDAAHQGFEQVLAHPLASDLQLARASAGLERCEHMPSEHAHDAMPTALVSRSRWGAAPAVVTRMTRTSQDWNRITVHHSAMSSGSIHGANVHAVASLLQKIQGEHMSGNGWGDIGYHYLIDPDGRVYEGRRLEFQGAHAGNHDLNHKNIGVCLLGNFETEQPTSRALSSLRGLIDELRGRYRISASRVYGHSDFKNTACPGHHLLAWVRTYAGGATLSASSSSSWSSERAGSQPSAFSLAGSPTSTSGSSRRFSPGAGRVR